MQELIQIGAFAIMIKASPDEGHERNQTIMIKASRTQAKKQICAGTIYLPVIPDEKSILVTGSTG